MTKIKMAVLICLGIFLLLALGFLISNDSENMAMIGLTGILLAAAYLIIGIVACIFPKSREAGKGILLSAGILLIIGSSVCSITMNM